MKRCIGATAICCLVVVALAYRPQTASAAGLLAMSPAIRSQGMGAVGVADNSDPTNAFFNPVIIASARGLFVTAAYNSYSYAYGADNQTDTDVYNLGVGAGFTRTLRNDLTGFLGVGLAYDALRSKQSFLYATPYEDNESYVAFELGAGAMIGEAFYAGLGAAVKPWWERVGFKPQEELSKTVYDLGAIARIRLAKTDGMELSTGLGASALNLGGSIKPGRVLPKMHRYGAELDFKGGRSEYCSQIMCFEVPLVGASLEYDYVHAPFDSVLGYGNWWGVGAEVAFYQIVYLRAGYDNFGGGKDYPTFGVGLGFGYQSFRVRIDFADVGSVDTSDYTDKYGFFLGFNY